MAAVDRGADDGVRLPGAYRTLLRQQCESQSEPDPRRYMGADAGSIVSQERTQDQHSAYQLAREQGAHDAAALLEERLKAGKPITVPRWRIGGHSVPAPKDVPLFRDRSIRSYTVYSDDRIEVAERHDPPATA